MAFENIPSDPIELRKMVDGWEKSQMEALPSLDDRLNEFYHDIPLSDGHIVKAKVISPKAKASSDRPLILFFHGGGFSVGSPEQTTYPGRQFALEFDAVFVAASYRLAPEHRFPQQALDGIDILDWLIKNAKEAFGASPETALIVGGHSAGANIATVAVGEYCSKGLQPPVTGLFLGVPYLFTYETVPDKYKDLYTAMDENETPTVGKKQIQDMHVSAKLDPYSRLFSPTNDPARLQLLPPTYMQAGGKDILRDDSIIFERVLRDAGVPTKLDVSQHLGHAPWSIFTKDDDPGTEELVKNTMEGMYWLLKG